MKAVGRAAIRSDRVTLKTGLTAQALVRCENGRVGGVRTLDSDGRAVEILASETILATGGVGGVYAVTTNPPSALGDGVAMAAVAGATIADPEFVQFHPTAIDVGRDPAPLATEALRGEGARLVDAQGRPLVDDPAGDLAARDIVARAVHNAITQQRGAFLDASRTVGAAFPRLFPTVFEACRQAGLDPRSAPIPVAPAAHYHMGGVATDLFGRAARICQVSGRLVKPHPPVCTARTVLPPTRYWKQLCLQPARQRNSTSWRVRTSSRPCLNPPRPRSGPMGW